MTETFTYSPSQSFVDSSFFVALSQLKIDVLKLDTSCQSIYGYYNFKSLSKDQSPSINISDYSFKDFDEINSLLPLDSAFLSPGTILNLNSIEEFKNFNKKDLLREIGLRLYNNIKNKSILANQTLLSEFFILSFADLKKYKFYYWFAFPQLQSNWTVKSVKNSISFKINEDEIFQDQINLIDLNGELDNFENLFNYDKFGTLKILFIDTSTSLKSCSYILRNLLTALSVYGFKNLQIEICRINHANTNFTIILENTENTENIANECPPVSGWERTSQNKLGPKFADLGSLIDPIQLADQAIDLNLKLMKWRLLPELDLKSIKETKCLLLGSGTLGCYVSRTLLAWGVRKITFVDNGKVSFSNPVRQPLFEYKDCLNGGKPKAETCAESLKKIFPSVESEGFSIEVPMIGHPITNESRQFKDYEKLCELIEDHDAIFLLMDSREARWLPTIIGNVKNKIVINAALGFESFLVMRHGCIKPLLSLESQIENRLGCYFCNDIYAPSNSISDRTLDQMCTVTRPGVALMASSLSVELLVSILQSKDRQYSEHSIDKKPTVLGSLPHQLRGFLHNFDLLKLSSKNFKYCSACSIKVLEEYELNGWEFVKTALSDSKYLEELTGLNKVHEEAENAALLMDELDIDSEDDFV